MRFQTLKMVKLILDKPLGIMLQHDGLNISSQMQIHTW